MAPVLLSLAVVWTLPGGSSAGGAKQVPVSPSPAVKLYERARGHVERGHLDLACELLAESFGYGFPSPMRVVTDTSFATLLADSVWRPKVRELIHRHAWDERASMVSPGVPGRRVEVEMNLRDEEGSPVPGAVVDFRQGHGVRDCSPEPDWEPGLFASLRSGDSGRVTAETILPDTTARGPGCPPAPHLHVDAERKGYEPCRGVVLLTPDSTAIAGLPEAAPWGATWGAQAVRKTASETDFLVTLGMHRTP